MVVTVVDINTGQCAGKAPHKGKQGESRGKDIPPNSPLGEMLENWEKEGKTKELDKVKMVQFCVEEWPREVIQEGPVHWPWYGSKEKWLCKALNMLTPVKVPMMRKLDMQPLG